MKILEINKFHFAKGGADKHFLDLVRLLESKGHEVAEFCMSHSQNTESKWSKYFVSIAGYTDEYNPWQKIKGVFRMFYSFEAGRKINRILDDFQPDIVHIHNIYHQLSPVILFEIKKRKIPIVMSVHDYKLINPNYNLYLNGRFYDRCKNGKYYQCIADRCVKNSYLKSFLGALEMYWHNKILKTYQKNVDLYIAPSAFAKNTLAEWGIDSGKIAILPHFINTENKTDTALPYSNAVNDKYGFYFGRISKEKGVDKLINVFEKLKEIKLYLAGAPENNFKIKESENIKYQGYLNQEQLVPFVENAKFIISCSKLPETFGLIVLEANAHGKPFVGFKAGAFPEIIENNINGILAETEEELRDILSKITAGEILFNGEEIKQLVNRKYNKETYYQNLLRIFANLKQT